MKHSAAILVCAALLLAALPLSAAPPVQSGFVTTSDGVRLHYLESGSGPAIVFVPGWTMPVEIWEHQIRHFAQSHRVVALDPRSQGDSEQTTEGHYPDRRAQDIKELVDELKLAPAVLVGWSMGVAEVVSYVDQFGTDSVRGLVLVDGHVGVDFDPPIARQWFDWISGFQKDRQKATEAFVRSMYKKPQGEDYYRLITQASLRTPTNTAMALLIGLMASDNRPALAKIDKPTLIVVAPSPYSAIYEDMHKRISGSRLETFEEAGHALFVDEPDRFNTLLEDFLNNLRAQKDAD